MGWSRLFTNLNILFFVDKKNTGKMARAQGKDRENTGNLVLIGAWQPCCMLNFLSLANAALYRPLHRVICQLSLVQNKQRYDCTGSIKQPW